MECLKRKTDRNRSVLLLFIFISILTLSGCSYEKNTDDLKLEKQSENLHKQSPKGGFKIIPLEIPEGEFDKAIGWLDNETLVYISNAVEGSNVYKYHLLTGRSTLLYKSHSPIVSVYISPSHDRILIHSSRSRKEGMITIVTTNGEEIASESIESFELAFEWNPYDENLLLVSSFTEEWDFRTFILNIKDKKLSEYQLPEPFVSWLAEDELIYLDWDKEHPSLLAPLKKVRYQSGEIETIMADLIQAKAFKENIMTIGPSQESNEKGVYTFYSNQLQARSSITVPLLTRYSGWLVPYFDLHPEHKRFYTFRPRSSGDADTYSGGFEFISIDIDTGEETVILENGENEPVSCSTDGTLCLYGYQLEKLIDIRKKTVFSLLKNDS